MRPPLRQVTNLPHGLPEAWAVGEVVALLSGV